MQLLSGFPCRGGLRGASLGLAQFGDGIGQGDELRHHPD